MVRFNYTSRIEAIAGRNRLPSCRKWTGLHANWIITYIFRHQ